MSRSILLEAPSASALVAYVQDLAGHVETLQDVVASTSRYARLTRVHDRVVGKLWYVRFDIETGDASGHNMVTKAAGALQDYLLQRYPRCRYVSISGNVCTDKKVSAVNHLLGRGAYVVAEMTVPRTVCETTLRCTPEALHDLNVKKNLIGSQLSGAVCSANAHVANALLAFYLATGQDGANVVEGSQAYTVCDVDDAGDLYMAVTLPNVIVGTVGHGKHHPDIQATLTELGCQTNAAPGADAERLARLVAGAVWCSELSLMAAQTQPGELVRSHMAIERGQRA